MHPMYPQSRTVIVFNHSVMRALRWTGRWSWLRWKWMRNGVARQQKMPSFWREVTSRAGLKLTVEYMIWLVSVMQMTLNHLKVILVVYMDIHAQFCSQMDSWEKRDLSLPHCLRGSVQASMCSLYERLLCITWTRYLIGAMHPVTFDVAVPDVQDMYTPPDLSLS